jgi:hypothetical protein
VRPCGDSFTNWQPRTPQKLPNFTTENYLQRSPFSCAHNRAISTLSFANLPPMKICPSIDNVAAVRLYFYGNTHNGVGTVFSFNHSIGRHSLKLERIGSTSTVAPSLAPVLLLVRLRLKILLDSGPSVCRRDSFQSIAILFLNEL